MKNTIMAEVTNINELFSDPYFEIDVNSQLLKSFLHFSEENIRKELQSLEDNRPQAIHYNAHPVHGILSNNQFFYAFVDNMNSVARVGFQFRQRLRQSVILQLYAFMETYLTKQCEVHKNKSQQIYGLEDLKGLGELDTIKIYYLKSMNIDMLTINKTRWDFIQNFKTLRNKIVHSEGKFKDLKTLNKLKSHSNENTYSLEKGITSDYYSIILQEKFILKCIDEVSDFLKETTVKSY